ncbi:S8 family serine peptidase [Rheinheimera sp.]|uniref:S8 family serine peptidase n=1 Tax=Rheinheimera sp. TaxID=1869214 RepID=UPI002733CFD4|nr:S8 family serine peptidase [Rheinheimera sp.]MDP2715650.1 S8 family serine peptidase [Rheinheimera sp.]
MVRSVVSKLSAVLLLSAGACQLHAAEQRLILTFEPQVAASRADLQQVQATSARGAAQTKLHYFSHFPQLAVVALSADTDIDAAIAQYSVLPGITAVERDHRVYKTAEPNDPDFAEQWHLKAGSGINAVDAWDLTTGDNQLVVAVIDTGVDYTHADLVDNIWQNPGETAADGIDNDGNGYIDDIRGINPADNSVDPMDEDGHGTIVAGIIAASGNNDLGIAGVNWQLKLLPCRFMDINGSGFVSDAIKCLDYVLDLKLNHGINIIATNNSWGSSSESQALYNAIAEHNAAGILFVASAGNDNSQAKFYPAAFDLPNVISVAAHDEQGVKADFSNYGRDWVDISAPGVEILSTTLADEFALASGTSMASPMVTAVAALLKAAEPALNMQQLRGRILASGVPATDALLAAQTASGSLLLASGPGQSGALNCVNQQLQRRMLPAADALYVAANSSIRIEVLSIDCDGNSIAAALTSGVAATPVSITDNGITPDIHAADGTYSGNWTFDGTATTLNFPDGVVQVFPRNNSYCTDNNVSEIPLAECNALVQLYYDTQGQNWQRRDNWLTTNLPCAWYGITCNGGSVTGIDLRENRLFGNIAAGFSQLSELESLNLRFNSLTGTFPQAILQLSKLQTLDLWSNALEGTIPAALGNLSALVNLDLSFNRFSGELPPALANLSALQQLFVEDNQLSGAIPSGLGQLSQLRILWLANNNFSGTLPQTLTGLSQLLAFSFAGTELCAPVNQQFGDWLAGLEELEVNTDCTNTAPLVSAGAAQQVVSGASVQLQATATDTDFNPLTYQWQQTDGPAVTLSSTDTLSSGFTAPTVSSVTILRFSFTADDGITSSTGTVTVTVNPLNSGGNNGGDGGSSGGGSNSALWLMALGLLSWRRLGKQG